MTAPSQSNGSMSPAEAAKFAFYLNGWAPVATNVVTPLITFWKMARSPVSNLQRYNQQVNELVRQFISGTIGLVSYFGGGMLTELGMKIGNKVRGKQNPDEAKSHMAKLVGGVVMSFIGFAFLRPYFSTGIILTILNKLKKPDSTKTIASTKINRVLDLLTQNGEKTLNSKDFITRLKAMAEQDPSEKALYDAQRAVKGSSSNWGKTKLYHTIADLRELTIQVATNEKPTPTNFWEKTAVWLKSKLPTSEKPHPEFNVQNFRTLVDGKKLPPPPNLSPFHSMAEEIRKTFNMPKKEAPAVKDENPTLKKFQKWMDEYLTKDGEPNVPKTTAVATVALTGYLVLLGGVLWGLNRVLGIEAGAPKSQGNTPASVIPPQIAANPPKPVSTAPYASYYQSPPSQGMLLYRSIPFRGR